MTVGTSSHGHGQTSGSDDGGTLTKGVLNSRSLGHPGSSRGVEENINANRISLSHCKSLGRDKTLMVGTIDKELVGKEAVIKKLEITMFE